MHKVPDGAVSLRALAFAAAELDGSIIQRFRTVVAQCGANPAVKYKGTHLTYSALDMASDGLAATLLARLGSAREPVALMYKHGAHYNQTQLAVLKTGKFYANLDPELPEDRQLLILRNLQARVLLCDSSCLEQALGLSHRIDALTVLNTVELPASTAPIDVNINPEDPAFIVYTSGSTGEPQGVVMAHRNVLMVAQSHGRDFHLTPADRASQVCLLWTAASGSEIFSALLNGATLYPFSIKEGGVFSFLKLVEEEALTTFTGTPILFRMLFGAVRNTQKFPSMRLIRLGGDRTTRKDIELYKRVFDDHCVLRLGYGSSEYLLVTQFFIDKQYEMEGEIAPVGFAMSGCEVTLLDDELREVGKGDFGEIAVTSRHLALGYWNDPVLTGKRFLSSGGDAGVRTYLTRDIGFLDQAGRLHHVGRSDSRVKIYGKMVLMSDVEQALLGIPGVKEAVVLPHDSGERGTELTAFVTVENEALSEKVLRGLLQEKLAAEVVPRKILVLENLPLQINNKINRLKLKELAGT